MQFEFAMQTKWLVFIWNATLNWMELIIPLEKFYGNNFALNPMLYFFGTFHVNNNKKYEHFKLPRVSIRLNPMHERYLNLNMYFLFFTTWSVSDLYGVGNNNNYTQTFCSNITRSQRYAETANHPIPPLF